MLMTLGLVLLTFVAYCVVAAVLICCLILKK